jgi:hypothetical protein
VSHQDDWIRRLEHGMNQPLLRRDRLKLSYVNDLRRVLTDFTCHMRWHCLDEGYDVCSHCERIVVPELAEGDDCGWHVLGKRDDTCETCQQFTAQERNIRWRMGRPA